MPKEIPLTRGKVALVDDEDFEWLSQYSWYLSNEYPASRVEGKFTYMHRLITGAGKGEVVDHINDNKYDNTRSNLRITTNQNNIRKSKMWSSNTSGYKGVARWKHKWRAYIRMEDRQKHLGLFECPKEAAKAYDEKAREVFGEYANTNFK